MYKLALFAASALLSASAAEVPASGVRLARSLLRAGKVEQALEQAVMANRVAPGGADTAVLLGDIYFRKADFETAERQFTAALAIDRNCAQAYLGLGRLDQLHFRRRAARQRFAQAYALDPSDPAIIRAYASVALDRQEEIALLQRYISHGAGEPREQLEAALGRLEFHRGVGDRKLGLLDGAYTGYRLHMGAWSPRPGRSAGLLLNVSINGSKPLHLVFDTGAAGIFVNAKAAAKLGLEYLSDAGARGVGETSSLALKTTLADTIRIGDVRFRNWIVEVADRPMTDQADGVIGASVFKQFMLQLDARRRLLHLIPYAEGAPQGDYDEQLWADRDRTVPPGMGNLIPVCQVGHLLLVNTKLNGRTAGYLVIDTGAAFTSVSQHVSSAGAVHFRIAGHDLTDPDVLTFDFRSVSNQEGVEISGLIGYPVLSSSALTIDYRDGLIGFDRGR